MLNYEIYFQLFSKVSHIILKIFLQYGLMLFLKPFEKFFLMTYISVNQFTL